MDCFTINDKEISTLLRKEVEQDLSIPELLVAKEEPDSSSNKKVESNTLLVHPRKKVRGKSYFAAAARKFRKKRRHEELSLRQNVSLLESELTALKYQKHFLESTMHSTNKSDFDLAQRKQLQVENELLKNMLFASRRTIQDLKSHYQSLEKSSHLYAFQMQLTEEFCVQLHMVSTVAADTQRKWFPVPGKTKLSRLGTYSDLWLREDSRTLNISFEKAATAMSNIGDAEIGTKGYQLVRKLKPEHGLIPDSKVINLHNYNLKDTPYDVATVFVNQITTPDKPGTIYVNGFSITQVNGRRRACLTSLPSRDSILQNMNISHNNQDLALRPVTVYGMLLEEIGNGECGWTTFSECSSMEIAAQSFGAATENQAISLSDRLSIATQNNMEFTLDLLAYCGAGNQS